MKESNLPKADFVTALILAVSSIAIVVSAYRMPRFEEVGAQPYDAPGLVPGLLGMILLILSFMLLMRSIRQKGYVLGVNPGSLATFFKDATVLRILITIGISMLYGMAFLGNLPYVLATGLYVLAFVIIFEYRRDQPMQTQWKILLFALLLAVLTAGAVAVVFRYLFLVNLP